MSKTRKQDDQVTCAKNNPFNITLPTVLCTAESVSDKSDVPKIAPLPSSESKLSLPSNLGTPTSPLRLSSPLSLPNSPTPFIKTSLQTNSVNPSANRPQMPSLDKQQSGNVESGSATGKFFSRTIHSIRLIFVYSKRLGQSK